MATAEPTECATKACSGPSGGAACSSARADVGMEVLLPVERPGKFLLDCSRRRMEEARRRMRERGLSDEELENRLYWDSLTFDVV
jgi:hypothetical protein